MEFTIRCISCNIDIVDILDTGSVKNTNTRARCPKCKDLTFFYKTSPNIKYNACNNICVIDVIQDNNTIVMETI